MTERNEVEAHYLMRDAVDMASIELKVEVDRLRMRLTPQLAELKALEYQYREARSREWIVANGVTSKQVQNSRGDDGLPWFFEVREFGRWMSVTKCTKPWADWNGCLYSSAELMAGKMASPSLAWAEHVPL